MRVIYPIILIVALMICYGFFKKSKSIQTFNKNIESFRNTTDFNDPSFKFFKALDDIKTSDKIILDNVQSKCYLTTHSISFVLKSRK